MSRHQDEALARGLAWAFLAAEAWTVPALVDAGATALGRRYRWLPRVAAAVVAAHRSPPTDGPYAFTRFVLQQTSLVEHADRASRRGSVVRVVRVPTLPGAMGVRRWPVPELPDLPALADALELPLDQLVWVADTHGLQRRTPDGPFHVYRHRWVERPGAAPRLLEVPTPLLRAVLRRVLDRILVWVPVHPAVHGFVRGRSAVTHAANHVGAESVVCLDLRAFFASITVNRVNGLFRGLGYPEPVAWALACLCTHPTPRVALAGMPGGGSASSRAWLRAGLRSRHLPQGAPTSPALANLAGFTLDRRLAGLAAATGLTYSRYADDLTFSGPRVDQGRFVSLVGAVVRDEGFALNPPKTRIRSAQQRQEVTGLVVNDRVNVPRAYHDQLRAVLHDATRNGPAAANRQAHPDFRSHLEGRVGWVESVNPVRGRRLRAQLEAVVWPA
ncbi:reverse transcriptase domain-containing protein [Microlunatus spumicola]|uniref:reverse transcriptase domain-containing protein n=1 Tax=Microlunatus spumicola TaxID=81499 RepID=UPI001959E107